MTRLSIEIPDDLKALLDARAAEAGCTLEGYVESLVRTEAQTIEYCAPPHLKCESRQKLEALALEGLATPTRGLTVVDWDRMRGDLIENRGKVG
jgi:hypothetical protein